MRTTHWKLFPCFCLGLLVMLAVGCGVGMTIGASPALRKLHWGIWLALTVLFPILALFLTAKGEDIPTLHVLSYLVNAVGSGCAYGVALGFLEVPFSRPFVGMLMAVALPAALAFLMCLGYSLSRKRKTLAILFTALGVLATLGSLFLGKWSGEVAFGACFGFLFFTALPIACAKTLNEPQNWLERLSISGFGAYLVVLVAAICLLLEDGPDGLFDGLFDGIVDGGDFSEISNGQKKQDQPRR